MNRETFAHYGWIIIVASVMAALLLTATPIGIFIGDAALNIFAGYKDTSDNILDKDHISDKEDEWEDMLFDGETFTATFITGGGTWEDGTTGNKTVDYDIKTELLAPAKVSKTGATFLGWQVTTVDGNWTAELFNNPNQTKLFGAAGKYGNVVFTARWDSDAYTATFYPNSGIWNSKVTTALTSAYTSDEILKAPTGISRLGYTFTGWKVTTADGNWTADKIYKGANTTDVAGSKGFYGTVSFTAQWTPNTYSIAYELNGGVSGGTQPTSATYDVQFNVTNPTKTGFAFSGWNIKGMSDDCTHYYGAQTTTKTELTGVRDTTFKNLRASSGTVTFTAVWNAETYSIQYDLNQGSSPNKPSFGVNHPESALVGEGFTVNNPTMEGYNFIGWTITGMDDTTHYYGTSSASNTSTKATKLEKVTGTWFKNLRGSGGLVKFVAQWEPKQYNITYGGNHYNTITAPNKGTFTKPISFSWTPKVRTGYTYILNSVKIYSGNNTSGVLLGTYTDATSASYTMTPKYYPDIFIFVDYAEVPNTYNIAYDLNKGTGSTEPKPGANNPTKGTYDIAVSISNPSRVGYIFNGWTITGMDGDTHYYGSNSTNETTLSNIKDTSFKNLRSTSGTVTFKATWTPITYNLVYNLNGGEAGGAQPDTATFDVQFNVPKPSKTAYKFNGWTITGMDSTTHYIGSATSTVTTLNNVNDTTFKNLRATDGTVTFTAVWGASTFNAVFNPNNGTWSDNTKTNKTVIYDVEKVLSAPTTISRMGYTFNGWKLTTQSGGNWTDGKLYNTSAQTTLEGKSGFYGDVTFVAQWTPRNYTITYGGTNGTATGPSSGAFDKSINISWVAENATGYHYVLKDVKVYSGNNSNGTVLATYTSGSNATYTMNQTYYDSIYVHVVYDKIPNEYTIAYDLNRGSSSNAPALGLYAPTKAVYDTTFTVSHPTMLGYTFTGWSISGMDGDTHYFGSNNTTATTLTGVTDTSFKNLRSTSGTVTFKATWTPNTYSISYNLNRGNATSEPVHGASHPSSAVYDVTFTVSNPTMKGYTFKGWTITGMDGTTHYYGSNTTTSTNLTKIKDTTFRNLRATDGTVTFTAIWIPNGEIDPDTGKPVTDNKIVYDLNKGTSTVEPKFGANHPTTYIYDVSFNVSHPTMSGWVFTGWTITGLDTDITHYYGDSPYIIVTNKVNPGATASTANRIDLTKATNFINLKKQGTITFTANWLKAVDELKPESFVYNGEEQKPSWVEDKPTGVTITGETTGTYVDEYTVTVTPEPGYCWPDGSTNPKVITWEITKRPITITGNSASKVYDGLALTNNGSKLTSGSLGNGDSATYTASGSITNAGKINNVPNVVIMKGSEDVTSNYNITKVNGTLEVTKRGITIKTESASKVYDGTALSKNTGTITSGSLAGGQTITININTSITNVGSVENAITSIVIKDASGSDTTSNYNISKDIGTLTVTKRPITIVANSKNKVYDGTALTDSGYKLSSGTLVSGHNATVTVSGSITNIGATSNVVSSVTIKDASGKDVTTNYDITKVNGTLRITATALHVQAGSANKAYDGTALTNKSGFTVTGGELGSGHVITVVNSGSITNVGSAENTISSITIKDASGNDVTDNYTIVTEKGTLTVTLREITITANSDSKNYDGTPLTNNGSKLTAGTIAPNQNATYGATGSITDIGKALNVPNVVIKDASGKDVTANYKVNKVDGVLEVTKAIIRFTKNNYTGTYDGLAHTGSVTITYPTSGNTILYGLEEGTYNLSSIPTFVDAGVYKVYFEITNDNYEAQYGYFTVTINKRDITVTAASASKPYDGTPLTKNSATLTNGTLVSGHTGTYTASGSIVNAGKASNIPNAIIRDASGNDVTKNYNVIKVNGTLHVTGYEITVEADSASKTYDGYPLSKTEGGKITSGSLISGHTMQVINTGSITNAGSVVNKVSQVVITDAEGNDVTACYDITPANGKLTVYKRNITVKANSASKEYDTTALVAPSGGTIISGSLVGDHSMTVNMAGATLTGAGTMANKISSVVIKSGNVDVTSNYNITLVDGVIEITKRAITVTGGSTSKVYDGTPLTYDKATITSGLLLPGHKATLGASGSQTEIGSSSNVPTIVIKDTNGNNVTSHYNIRKVNGTLRVTDGSMSVTDSDYSGVYDGRPHTGSVTVSAPDDDYTITYGTTSGKYNLTSAPTYVNVGNYTVYYKVTHPGANAVTGSFTVTITKRSITITGISDSKAYDGTPLEYDSATITSGSLATGDKAVLGTTGSQTLPGTSANRVYYTIKNSSGANAESNYNITVVNGTLTVTGRTITVTAEDKSKEYDGTPLKHNVSRITNGSLLSGHKATLGATGSQTEVGSSANVPTIVIRDASGNDVTGNYNIRKVNGKLTVTDATTVAHVCTYTEITTEAGCETGGKIIKTCTNKDGLCSQPVVETITTSPLGHWSSAGTADGSCGTHHHFSDCSEAGEHVSAFNWSCQSMHEICGAHGYTVHTGWDHAYCARATSFVDSGYSRKMGDMYYCNYQPWRWCFQHSGWRNAGVEFTCSHDPSHFGVGISHPCSKGQMCNPFTLTFVVPGEDNTVIEAYRAVTYSPKLPSGYSAWATSSTATTGVTSIQPTSDATYYAVSTCKHEYEKPLCTGSQKCKKCTYVAEKIDHLMSSYMYAVNPATGKESDYSHYRKCLRDGCTHAVSSAHNYTKDSGVVATNATCEANQKNYAQCADTFCKHVSTSKSYVVEVAGTKLGHDYQTPSDGGTATVHKKCTRCTSTQGSSYHSYTVNSGVQYKAATCTTNRQNYKKCTCGYNPQSASYVIAVTGTALGHNEQWFWSAWAQSSNYPEKHYRTKSCKRDGCDYVEYFYEPHEAKVTNDTTSTHSKCSVCDKVISTSHTYNVQTSKVYKAATCTTNKWVYYKCACGYNPQTASTAKEVANSSLGHDMPVIGGWSDWENPSSTSTQHRRYRVCQRCGGNKTYDYADHSYSSSVTKEATCTATGVKTYTCKNCTRSYTETIAKKAHDMPTIGGWSDWANYGNASQHRRYRVCKVCGGNTTYDYADHSFTSSITKAATCTATGTRKYSCKNCTYTYNESIAMTAHSYAAATCTKPKTCSCGATSGSSLGHSMNGGKQTKDPTCQATGTITYSCTRSGCSYTSTSTVAKIACDAALLAGWKYSNYNASYCKKYKECKMCGGATVDVSYPAHSWNSGSVTKSATCTVAGTRTYKCNNCSRTKTETITALGHSMNGGKQTKDPTCTATGTITYSCTRSGCTHTTTSTVAKIACEAALLAGWKYSNHSSTSCKKYKVCKMCGGATVDVSYPAHSWNGGSTVSNATCTAAKQVKYTCKNCDRTKQEASGSALGHNYAAATCTKAKTCTRCSATSGSALGHSYSAATCTAAKKCSRCGGTSGSALGHSYSAATCTKAKTCTRCKATSGSALGHKYSTATCQKKATCSRCGGTTGSYAAHKKQLIGNKCKWCGKKMK